MRAMDVMTTNVITVDPETSVQALATLLSERAISGVPVVDRDNRLVGVVTEGDLLHRAETGTERRTQRRRLRWLDAFATDQEAARDYVKSHGRIVREIMTREVISVSDTTDLADIATLLETKKIKRVPVLRGQARWHREPGEPGAGAGDDQERARHRGRQRRPHDPCKTARRAQGTRVGSHVGCGYHRPRPGRPSVVLRRPIRGGKAGGAGCRREHSGSAKGRGTHRARSHHPVILKHYGLKRHGLKRHRAIAR